jgi:hypothetical protein
MFSDVFTDTLEAKSGDDLLDRSLSAGPVWNFLLLCLQI